MAACPPSDVRSTPRVLFAPPAPRPLRADPAHDPRGYRSWFERRERARLAANGQPPEAPVITVLLVVDHPDATRLERCVRSVAEQTSDRWHLSVTVVGTPRPQVDAVLTEALASRDRRQASLRTVPAGTQIPSALAGALEECATPACVILEQHDQLAPDAIALLAAALTEADLAYADEDRVDDEGRGWAPLLKPDWSPELCLSWCYTGRPLAFRVGPVVAAGGIRAVPDGDWLHDLVLRTTEQTSRVAHVAEVLAHAQRNPGEGTTTRPGSGAVVAALGRRHEDADVEAGPLPGTWSLRRRPTRRPLVTVIVPFRDSTTLLRACVDSVVATAGDLVTELLLVDNGSTEPETLTLLDHLDHLPEVTVRRDDRPFNWAGLNNAAAEHALGEVLLFLNDDVVAQGDGWLAALAAQALRAEVGAAGARLVYPTGGVQHAGIVLGLFGVTGHVLAGLPETCPGYLGMAVLARDVAAVTGACMATRRHVFEQLGGFDEELGLEFNDIDYCLRARARGLRVVYEPAATLVHHESPSRGTSGSSSDAARFVARWHESIVAGDPYYNRNLSRADFSAALPDPDEGR